MVTKYDADQLAAAARRGGWSGGEVPIAVAVALAESSGRMVTNDSIGETPKSRRGVERCASYGPWQINYCPGRDAGSARETAAKSTDLDTHAKIAYSIYRQQGWRAWTMYRNGGYKRYVQVAEEAAGSTATGAGDGGSSTADTIRDGVGDAALDATTAAIPGLAIWRALLGTDDDADGGGVSTRLALGQLALGVALVVLGLVLLLREVAPEVVELAAGAATGGGSVAAGAASGALT